MLIIFLVCLMECVLYNLIVVPDGIDSVNLGGLQANLQAPSPRTKVKKDCQPQLSIYIISEASRPTKRGLGARMLFIGPLLVQGQHHGNEHD